MDNNYSEQLRRKLELARREISINENRSIFMMPSTSGNIDMSPTHSFEVKPYEAMPLTESFSVWMNAENIQL